MHATVAIHYEPYKQFSSRLQVYEAICQHNGIRTERVCSSDLCFWDCVRHVNAFIYHWGQWDTCRQNAKAVIPIVEGELGIRCYPNVRTCWAFDDKIRQSYLSRAHGLPMAESWVFWEKDAALAWADTATLPVVFKLAGGAGSTNVILVRTRRQLLHIIYRMFSQGIRDHGLTAGDGLGLRASQRVKRKVAMWKRKVMGQKTPYWLVCPNWVPHRHYVFFQEYLPNNEFDTRVTVIGDRVFAFRRHNRKGDFRSSGSGLIDYCRQEIDRSILKLALTITRRLGFQSMAYDFLRGPGGEHKFVEMSYTYVDTAVCKCPGFWDSEMQWHAGHFVPQHLQLMDLLKRSDLIMPQMEGASDVSIAERCP